MGTLEPGDIRTMEKPNITFEHLKLEVVKLAQESPDNTYAGIPGLYPPVCKYAEGKCRNGSVGCIFGQAFQRLGVDPAEVDWIGEGVISDVLEALRIETDSGQRVWADKVQEEQDRGICWDEAIEAADAEVDSYRLGRG